MPEPRTPDPLPLAPWLQVRPAGVGPTSDGGTPDDWEPVAFDEHGWRAAAACRQQDPRTFFPVGATGPAVGEIAAAKTVCRSCPVRLSCLHFALVTNQEYGVWGGHDEEERRELRRRWRRLGRPFPVMRTAPSDVVHRIQDAGPVHRAG